MENKICLTEQQVQEYIKQVRTWDKVPWKHQGRSRVGVDCVGLFTCAANEIGITINIPNNYTHEPDPKVLISHMEQFFDRVKKQDRQVGDFVLMRFPDMRKRVPNRHVALITKLGIIHAAAQFRQVTEHSLDEEWLTKIEYVYRIPRI